MEGKKKSIVVIGGGTGTHVVLSGLKKYSDEAKISVVVTMADSGGSTGRLRDEFGFLPVGDARMALVALAKDNDEHEQLIRELFLYRFSKGTGLSGHNFGNLLLTALTDILGSEEAAIKAASRVLRVKGDVLPVTNDDVHLIATYEDGVEVVGEAKIDEPDNSRDMHRITNLRTEPKGEVTKDAKEAICGADCIVLGPGDLYTSVLATCVVDDVAGLIQSSKAKLFYVSNLMTKFGQTSGYTLADHVCEIEKYVGRKPDAVFMNTTPFPEELLERYIESGENPVEADADDSLTIIEGDYVSEEEYVAKDGDVLKRSLIRHNPEKLADAIMKEL